MKTLIIVTCIGALIVVAIYMLPALPLIVVIGIIARPLIRGLQQRL
jgi:hypothetical protein